MYPDVSKSESSVWVLADLVDRIQRIFSDLWALAYAKIQPLLDEREASTLAPHVRKAEG